MLRLFSILFSFTFLLYAVYSQTVTVPDPDGSGNNVVEVVTVDALGNPTTVILSTIIATTTALADAPDQEQGPVGQPPPTLTGPPQIVYIYTTTDDAGDRDVITTTFTPTYQTPNPTTPLSSGTVWALSEYTASFGTGAAATHTGAANTLMATHLSTWRWTIACGVMAFGAGGILLF